MNHPVKQIEISPSMETRLPQGVYIYDLGIPAISCTSVILITWLQLPNAPKTSMCRCCASRRAPGETTNRTQPAPSHCHCWLFRPWELLSAWEYLTRAKPLTGRWGHLISDFWSRPAEPTWFPRKLAGVRLDSSCAKMERLIVYTLSCCWQNDIHGRGW